MRIRAARAAEIPRLRELDWDAEQIFGAIGMPEITEFEPPPFAQRADSQRAGPSSTTPPTRPGLREVRAHENALGLDRWPRVCMRRDLTP
jgi:hypothetical protein